MKTLNFIALVSIGIRPASAPNISKTMEKEDYEGFSKTLRFNSLKSGKLKRFKQLRNVSKLYLRPTCGVGVGGAILSISLINCITRDS